MPLQWTIDIGFLLYIPLSSAGVRSFVIADPDTSYTRQSEAWRPRIRGSLMFHTSRNFGPGSADLPQRYRAVGQPVFIPGSMGTRSFVLVGAAASADLSFGSCCHGAGRALSRHAAKRQVQGHVLRKELEAQGIVVRCASNAELAEEAPVAYKDVARVVEVVAKAGIARKVARLRPWGVLKG